MASANANNAVPTQPVAYETRLAQDLGWTLDEGRKFFQNESAPHHALQRIARRLNQLQIPYAVVGGMALAHHGFRRFTEDVDILVSREGLKEIHAHLDGLGYVRPFSKSKNLRDAELGVKIEFLIAGEFPGDGKPKPVEFPDPSAVAETENEICFVNLPTFIELKLASGMSNPLRGKDLVDVQELIQSLRLPASFAEKLNAYVQPVFAHYWNLVYTSPARYIAVWKLESAVSGMQTLADLIDHCQQQGDAARAETLRSLAAAGVTLDAARSTDREFVLTTADLAVAQRFDMVPADEYFDG